MVAALGFALGLSMPVQVVAQGESRVNNVFLETDLRQAIEDIAAQAGVNIIADPSVQGLVSLTLTDVSVEKALDLVLTGTPYQVHATEDYFLVFNPDETTGIFPSVAQTRIVPLQYAAPETARGLLPNPLQRYVRPDQSGNAVAVTAPPELLRRILEDLGAIDRPTTAETVFVRLAHVRAVATRALLPEPLQRFVRADAERNTLSVSAPAGARGQILAQIRRLDVPLGAGSFDIADVHRTSTVKLNHVKAVTTRDLLPPALQDLVRADETSNTLAISAPPHMMPGILADIAAIDLPRQHVMLDARVVVLERGDFLAFGADWVMPQIRAGTVVGDGIDFPWELRIGYSPTREFTNALSLTLNLLTENNEATIVASPQILAQEGREAEIKVTTEEDFQITSNVGTFLRAELEKIETGTILRILPQVGPDGQLTLDMNLEVSDVIARGEENLPVVSRRIAHSTVQIESGGTAAVAGLVDTRAQFGRRGIPGARNLPLLGRAFSTDTLGHQARQVAVFVTATLVDRNERRFLSGNERSVGISTVDEGVYRQELVVALEQLGAVSEER